MTSRRVATCVVTGFLGSGKTTLLKGLLERAPDRERIAVVVNEIGEIGIDGRVLTGFDYVENVVELASGCVCCSIDEYRFDLAVDELLRRLDPTLLVLETTGVADPGPTLERLRRCGLGVDAVVTVVDARAWARAWRVSRAARRQVTAADFLVLSKCDLVPPRTITKLRSMLTRANPRALILESSAGTPLVGGELLLATSAIRAARPPGQAETGADPATGRGHLEEDGIESLVFRSEAAIDREAFARFLEGLPRQVLRAKGFLRPHEGGCCTLFQVVCGRVEMTGFEGGAALDGGLQAVFLGRGIASLNERLAAGIRDCERGRVERDPR
jgi:cobalamin biosynthesis protein CobW